MPTQDKDTIAYSIAGWVTDEKLIGNPDVGEFCHYSATFIRGNEAELDKKLDAALNAMPTSWKNFPILAEKVAAYRAI